MKKNLFRSVIPFCAAFFLLYSGCAKNKTGTTSETGDTSQKKAYNTPEDLNVARNLARFDSLDLVAFNKQDTNLLYKFYNDSVVVAYPDGHETSGSAIRIADLKEMFEQTPDIKVESHLVKFGSSDWTCVTGMLSGSSSKPSKGIDSKQIPPTGKNFVIPFCSIAHWKEGRIVEQRIFWDNKEMAKQMEILK
jgi:hypothetical protein